MIAVHPVTPRWSFENYTFFNSSAVCSVSHVLEYLAKQLQDFFNFQLEGVREKPSVLGYCYVLLLDGFVGGLLCWSSFLPDHNCHRVEEFSFPCLSSVLLSFQEHRVGVVAVLGGCAITFVFGSVFSHSSHIPAINRNELFVVKAGRLSGWEHPHSSDTQTNTLTFISRFFYIISQVHSHNYSHTHTNTLT